MPPMSSRGRLRLVESPPPLLEETATPAPATVVNEVAPALPEPRRPKSSSPRLNLTDLSDAQLVALGSKGENKALEVLYRRHAPFAIHLATRIEGSARDVEDIVHDAFLRAFERLNDLADPAAFRSWLGAIVVHAVRSRMRRTRLMNVLGLGRSSEPVDLDALASQGWWFENLYATGTRSVRGLEALITGFTPTPAQSVVKLGKSQRDFDRGVSPSTPAPAAGP